MKSWHVTLALLGTACAAPGSTSTTDASESSTHAQSSDPASGSPTDTSTTQAGSGDTTDTGVVTDATVTTDPDDGSGTGGDALVHGEPYVVAGAFLAKPMAAPLVWDDCSHGDDPLDRWTTVYPNTSTDSVAPGEEWSCREAPFTRPQGEAAIAIAHPTARGTH
ncbi:MAG TPA: hypothetical protein VG755_33980, partial [Nannocystaceae bacterium]|nr:hypothetical protein [Nannocystaceae bacterium]